MLKNRKKNIGEISLARVVVPSPEIVKNLSRTYMKLHCKGGPYWYRQTDRHTHTHRKTQILLLYYMDFYYDFWLKNHKLIPILLPMDFCPSGLALVEFYRTMGGRGGREPILRPIHNLFFLPI